MQSYIDSATQQVWEFDDNVAVTQSNGTYVFHDANGNALAVPATLVPYTPAAPTAAQLLAQAQAAQIRALQNDYLAAINAPVAFTNSAGVASTYPAGNTVAINGETATQNLQDVIDAGAAAWTLGKWFDVNGVAQTFTFSDVQGLAVAMEAAQTVDMSDLITKVAEVQSATTVAAVQAVTF